MCLIRPYPLWLGGTLSFIRGGLGMDEEQMRGNSQQETAKSLERILLEERPWTQHSYH
jgi:hypothetical protein